MWGRRTVRGKGKGFCRFGKGRLDRGGLEGYHKITETRSAGRGKREFSAIGEGLTPADGAG